MAESGRGVMARREFMGVAALAFPAAATGLARPETRVRQEAIHEGYPRNDPARVQAVVGASHANFERVRELVLEQPTLAKASWDWGFGDWETALGAASHTGRREIAEFLIAHGAQPTIFSAAMLGQVDTVRAYLEADPTLHLLHGPHGIPLADHARVGGEPAQSVLAYLAERFGPDERPTAVVGTDELQSRYGGAYVFDEVPELRLSVAVRNGFLLVGAGETPSSRVLRLDEDAFHPSGAPAVRLLFDVADGRARGLTIVDGAVRITGRRV